MANISILLIGDTRSEEFRDARAMLDATAQVTAVADMPAAIAQLTERGLVPELVVLAQAYPSQFSHEDVDRLRRAAPLTRVLGLMGSWCEGEMRTGRPWPAALRTYWHQWEPRWQQQSEQFSRGDCCQWTLPITATDEERILQTTFETLPGRQGMVGIYSWSYEMEDWLSTVCRGWGLSTVWLRPPGPARVDGAAAVLFDGTDLHTDELEQLGHLVATFDPAPVLVLLDFPRIQDRRRALEAGAAGVVSKPLHIEDLYWHLQRVLAPEEVQQ